MSHSGEEKRPRPTHADLGQKPRANPGREDPNDAPLIAYRDMRAFVLRCAMRAADDLQAQADAVREWAQR